MLTYFVLSFKQQHTNMAKTIWYINMTLKVCETFLTLFMKLTKLYQQRLKITATAMVLMEISAMWVDILHHKVSEFFSELLYFEKIFGLICTVFVVATCETVEGEVLIFLTYYSAILTLISPREFLFLYSLVYNIYQIHQIPAVTFNGITIFYNIKRGNFHPL